MSIIRQVLNQTLNSPPKGGANTATFAVFSQSSGPVPKDQRARAIFFTGLFSMLAKLAKADGHIHPAEIKAMEKAMRTTLFLEQHEQTMAVAIFRRAKDSTRTFEDFAQEFYEYFRKEKAVINAAIDMLFAVSLADGVLENAEDHLLDSTFEIFRLGKDRLNAIRAHHAMLAPSEGPYKILGCSSRDSMETIKKAYRKLVKECHPDYLRNHGMSAEFTDFASQRFVEIQDAYDKITEQRAAKK